MVCSLFLNRTSTRRAVVRRALGLGAGALIAGAAWAADYPTRPITLVVPFAAGGGTDAVARLVADKLGPRLNTTVVVMNKPGAGTQIGLDYVKQAAPDGYTLGMSASTLPGGKYMMKSFTLDPLKDFTHIITLVESYLLLVAHPDLPAKNMTELIAYAKANPGKLNFGTTGGSVEMDLALLNARAGINLTPVVYKGVADTQRALLANEVQLTVDALRSARALADTGKLRIIGVGGPRRLSQAPNLPTLAEAGLPGYDLARLWFAISGPVGVPREIVDRLNAEVNAVLKLPEVVQQLGTQFGYEIAGGSPDAVVRLIREDDARFQETARITGIKPQ